MPQDLVSFGVVLAACVLAVAAFAVMDVRRRRVRARAIRSVARATASIDRLTGATFDSVQYAGDVPQLVFVGQPVHVLTLRRLPAVLRGTALLRAGQPGHRQALASLHGQIVFVARFSGEDELVLEFANGSLIVEQATAR